MKSSLTAPVIVATDSTRVVSPIPRCVFQTVTITTPPGKALRLHIKALSTIGRPFRALLTIPQATQPLWVSRLFAVHLCGARLQARCC